MHATTNARPGDEQSLSFLCSRRMLTGEESFAFRVNLLLKRNFEGENAAPKELYLGTLQCHHTVLPATADSFDSVFELKVCVECRFEILTLV
jgi:hypothetical protein